MDSSHTIRALAQCHKLYKVVTNMKANMKAEDSYLLIEPRLALVKVGVEEDGEETQRYTISSKNIEP